METGEVEVVLTAADWDRVMTALIVADAHRVRPPDWRPSEYVMNKAHAQLAAEAIRHQLARHDSGRVALSAFTWTLLLSEIARSVVARAPADPVRRRGFQAYDLLAEELDRSPDYRQAVELAGRVDRARKRLEAAERAAKLARDELDSLEGEARLEAMRRLEGGDR